MSTEPNNDQINNTEKVNFIERLSRINKMAWFNQPISFRIVLFVLIALFGFIQLNRHFINAIILLLIALYLILPRNFRARLNKPYGLRHLVITFILIGTVLVLMLSGANPKDTNQQEIPPETIPTQSQPKPKPSNEPINYQKISLSEIPNHLDELVEVGGVVTSGAKTDNYYYIHLQDGQSHAILDISNKSEGGKKMFSDANSLNVGDRISIKALAAKMNEPFCGIQGRAEKEIKALCEFLNIPFAAPFLLAMDDLVIIKRSGSVVKAIQPIPPPQIDYSSFQKIHVSDYAKNPPAYLDKNIKVVSGLVSDFLAAGDRGGNTNFILVLDASDIISQSKMMLEIESSNEYKKAISSLNKGDLIVAYGIGKKSSSFDSALGGTTMVPTIKVIRIDNCNPNASIICSDGNTTTLFSH